MTIPDSEPINVRLRTVSQLFNTLDPFPFRERAIAPEAENYIIGKAELLTSKSPICIDISFENADATTSGEDVAVAIRSWFTAKADTESNCLRLLFRDGRRAFFIGLFLLSICLLIVWYVTLHFAGRPYARVLEESFVIIGWVVIWRPAEMFLYDWLPIMRRRNLYRRIAMANVKIENSLLSLPERTSVSIKN